MPEFKCVFLNLCVLVLWTKVASALEGFNAEMGQFSERVRQTDWQPPNIINNKRLKIEKLSKR